VKPDFDRAADRRAVAAPVGKNLLATQDNQVELLQDYAFKTPSQAAGLLLARSANGRLDWMDASGITLKEHQERAAAAASAEAEP
jgi:hypothetical protein